MPKPTAIQLRRKNLPVISTTLGMNEEKVMQIYIDYVVRPLGSEPAYLVANPYPVHARRPYLVFGRGEFLDSFASVPFGIEDRFVPVTQIKKD